MTNKMRSETVLQTDRILCSFVLPVYNVYEYIEDCIKSIVNQDINNYEIICIDDKSIDGTSEKLSELKNKYQIKVVKNDQNYGVCYSRNKGISISQGRYIWFVDPDDLLAPGIAEQFLKEALVKDADYVYGNYKRVPEEFSFAGNEIRVQCCFENSDYAFSLPVDENATQMNAIWAGPFKREFLLRNNLYFRDGMIAQEDTMFYYELKQKDVRVFQTQNVCYLYRQRKSSIMHIHSDEKNKNYYKSMCVMLDVYNQYLESEKCRDKNELLQRIHHTKENIAWTLAIIKDDEYVHRELTKLKLLGIYPYRLRWHLLITSRPMIMKIMMFSLPIQPLFWFVHKVFSLRQ